MRLESTEKRNVRLLGLNSEKAIYEEGWWMSRADYDFVKGHFHSFEWIKRPLGLDRNKDTKQITYFFLPTP